MHRLMMAKARGPEHLEREQKELGFNLIPRGLLMHESLACKVVDAVCYDWMHIYVVSGIFQREVGMLLGKLHKMRPGSIKVRSISAVVQAFTSPAYFRGSLLTTNVTVNFTCTHMNTRL